MTLYLSHLLEPLFEDVRQGILHNPLLSKRFVPIIRGEAKNLPPSLLDLGLSDNAILQKLHYFVINSFPEPRISAKKHIPSPYGTVGKYIDRFSIVIHGRIAEALAAEAVQDRSEKSRNMLRFLIIVNIIHELAHILRSVFHESHLWTVNIYRYPYSIELGIGQPASTIPEAGLMAEQGVFGGIVGVVFEDEIGGERPPFFEIGYDRISHFYLQCGDGRAYRLDSDAVASKMESGFSTPFDTETLPKIPVPRSPKERTCAWLNSTHLPRRTGPSAPQHIDELQGKPLQLSPKTPRAKRMERDGYSPVPKCCVACTTLRRPPESECSPWVYSPVDDSRLYCTLVR